MWFMFTSSLLCFTAVIKFGGERKRLRYGVDLSVLSPRIDVEFHDQPVLGTVAGGVCHSIAWRVLACSPHWL